MTNDHNELQAMRDELAAMRAELAELRVDQSADASTNVPLPREHLNRRQWMKAAAAAAVGGAAVAVGSSERAAAANGENLVIGNRGTGTGTQLATSPTQLNYTGTEDLAFVVQSGTSFSATSSSRDAVIGGWTSRSVNPIGVYGFANTSVGSSGVGVLGRSDSSGSTGVEGEAGGSGSTGVSGRTTGSGSFAVDAQSTASNSTGLRARATATNGVGVSASGSTNGGNGVVATGATGVRADGNLYGAWLTGDTAGLLLAPTTTQRPAQRSDAHVAGEVCSNVGVGGAGTGELWVCVEPGSPGLWRRVAGPDTAGAFTAIAPVRMYDSRRPAPMPGRIASGDNRVVSVADARDRRSGEVVTADVIPIGATAVTYNVTLDGTAGGGYLSVNPGDAATFSASSINWSSPGSTLANAGVVKLDGSRQVKVFCGGVGSTDFIVDITGYYL